MTTVATPTTPAEWEEYLNTTCATPEKARAAFANGSFQAALKSYTESQHASILDLKAEAREQAQLVYAEMLKNGAKSIRVPRGVDGAKLYNKNAPGAGLDGKYGSAVEFFQNALRDPSSMVEADHRKRQELRNYSSQTGEGGGFLIPEEWRSEIFSGPALEQAIVRPRATVIPMGSNTLHYPAVDFSTEVGEVWGGMVFYWMDESGTIPDTSAMFADIEFNARRLAGAAVVPMDTLKDAGALDAWLRSSLPVGIREFEDRAFLKANGVKKPLGALNAANPSLVVASKEVGQSANTITWNNILAMFARFLPESYENGVWIVTPDAIPEIYTMAVVVGTGGSAVMTGNAAVSPSNTLLGLPIKVSRKAPAVLGTQGDVNLADFSYYGVADRQDVRVDTSEHAQFLQDNMVFKVIERVDGQPLLLSALTPENGGPTLSAFVQLETRS